MAIHSSRSFLQLLNLNVSTHNAVNGRTDAAWIPVMTWLGLLTWTHICLRYITHCLIFRPLCRVALYLVSVFETWSLGIRLLCRVFAQLLNLSGIVFTFNPKNGYSRTVQVVSSCDQFIHDWIRELQLNLGACAIK